MTDSLSFDVAIVGAGPAGLAFARSLAGSGLSVAVLEKAPLSALAEPAFDGREIALTQGSIRLLRALGAWDRLAPDERSDLRSARVLNGGGRRALVFAQGPGRDDGPLGVLVPNHAIRRALFAAVQGQPGLTLMAGRGAASCRIEGDGRDRWARLGLDDGGAVSARLVAAADSRFSPLRDALGVGAEINRLGRSMMVCRIRHDTPHGHVASEWFDHGQTIALLPLNGENGDARTSSLVLTLDGPRIQALAALDPAACEAELARRLGGRLGAVTLASSRHVYPLATTWSHRFAGPGYALIGDAAVGMHPVTAHGFNLGLKSQHALAAAVRRAQARGRDIGDARALAAYEHAHRRAAWPLYQGTNLIARLYADERPRARLARHALLALAQATPPFRQGVLRLLRDPQGPAAGPRTRIARRA